VTLRQKESSHEKHKTARGAYAQKYYEKYGKGRLGSEGNILDYSQRNFLDNKSCFFKKGFQKTEGSDNAFILKERGIPDFGFGHSEYLLAGKDRPVDFFGRRDHSGTLNGIVMNYSTLNKKSQFLQTQGNSPSGDLQESPSPAGPGSQTYRQSFTNIYLADRRKSLCSRDIDLSEFVDADDSTAVSRSTHLAYTTLRSENRVGYMSSNFATNFNHLYSPYPS
jgi:hypothetical protein